MSKFNQAEFENEAKKMVAKYCEADEKDVLMVWFSKVGSNAKAMLSTDLDCRYYEVTYIGEEDWYVVDIYDLVGGKNHKEDSNGKSIDKSPTSGD